MRWLLRCAWLGVLISTAAPAHAQSSLPPNTGEILKDCLQTVSSLRIGGIGVQPRFATIELCLHAAPQSCFKIRVDDPKDNCDAEPAGAWCPHWEADKPPADVRAAVRDALRACRDPWQRPGYPRLGEGLEFTWDPATANRQSLHHAAPILIALGLVITPAVLGITLGRVFRRPSWRRFSIGVLGTMILSLAGVSFGAFILQRLVAWDIALLATLLALSFLVGSATAHASEIVVLGVSLLLACLGLEYAVRLWMPTPQRFPGPEQATLASRWMAADLRCAALYEVGPLVALSDIPVRSSQLGSEPQPRLVVHLGDSMTFGPRVYEEKAFPAALRALQPDVHHFNFGIGSADTDFEFLALHRILAVHSPTIVVLHVFTGNDINGIDEAYGCCDSGPLLDYHEGGPTARCPEPRWHFSLRTYLARSPAPYPLRVATAESYAARHMVVAFSRLVFGLETSSADGAPSVSPIAVRWQHFEQILAKLRDELGRRHVRFVVTILPDRHALESEQPANVAAYQTGRRVAAVTARLGIETLDAWELFADALRKDGSRPYFLDDNDIHFSVGGHLLVAKWLAERLGDASPSSPKGGPSRSVNAVVYGRPRP
jgi:hypothetical protein